MARQHDESLGPGADRSEPVPEHVQLSDLTPAAQQRAQDRLRQAGYYAQAAARIQHALEQEQIPAVFSLQPELILSSKPLTAVEVKFAHHMRQISRRYTTYMYQELRPAISRLMAESSRRNGSVFVDLGNTFKDIREKTFTDYCHLTPRGDDLIAEQLYQAMAPTLIAKLIAANPAATTSPK
jgi:hypothetical protein